LNLFDVQDGKLVQKVHIFEAQIGKTGGRLLSKVREQLLLLNLLVALDSIVLALRTVACLFGCHKFVSM